eukprot:gene4993-biopygen5592
MRRRRRSDHLRRTAKRRPRSVHSMPKVRRNVPKALRACATVLRTVTKQWRLLGEKSAHIRNMGPGVLPVPQKGAGGRKQPTHRPRPCEALLPLDHSWRRVTDPKMAGGIAERRLHPHTSAPTGPFSAPQDMFHRLLPLWMHRSTQRRHGTARHHQLQLVVVSGLCLCMLALLTRESDVARLEPRAEVGVWFLSCLLRSCLLGHAPRGKTHHRRRWRRRRRAEEVRGVQRQPRRRRGTSALQPPPWPRCRPGCRCWPTSLKRCRPGSSQRRHLARAGGRRGSRVTRRSSRGGARGRHVPGSSLVVCFFCAGPRTRSPTPRDWSPGPRGWGPCPRGWPRSTRLGAPVCVMGGPGSCAWGPIHVFGPSPRA